MDAVFSSYYQYGGSQIRRFVICTISRGLVSFHGNGVIRIISDSRLVNEAAQMLLCDLCDPTTKFIPMHPDLSYYSGCLFVACRRNCGKLVD